MLYVGIDHSMTAFGVAAVRPDWELDFSRVRRATWETPASMPLVERRRRLAGSLVAFVRETAAELKVPLYRVRAAVEGGIFNKTNADTIRSQERLAGVIEHELWKRLGVELSIAEQRSVRSVFMGKSASGGKGAGEAAQELLLEAVPETKHWYEAELDAFLVANYCLAEAGEAFISCAPAVEEEKPKRAKRVA